ncbi:N-acetylneuraminate lyase [Alkalibacillus haloalkaliphilus]|uniref:N-acetylneuraminate lyase n=1 Tax=Alkalibacillus haloalkaliphilus TaxID=94136 RepID=A0A511W8G4_9BACI|nr:N-acetylneuraminate lyase [Alkalibacillus haloalkaliphilus]GEN46638.1 N-acetylneuraminate lyase [Alkalibacillus haloalkaliphilus]
MKGVFSALLCSFDDKGNVNEKGLREIVRYNLDECGVDGLYVNGSTGENFLISTEQKKEIFQVVKDEVGDEAQLIGQIGSLNIDESVELGHYVKELGYDAMSAVTPYYYKFNFDEVKNYYSTLVNQVEFPLVVYSIPALTGVNMSLEQFGELFKLEHVIGVKFTAPDFFLLERLRHAYPDQLIYSGFDEMLLSASVLGIDGAIGSTFNVNGKMAKEILTDAQAGNINEARSKQKQTNDLIAEVLDNGLYQTLKQILKVKGVQAGECRKPMNALSPEGKERAEQIVNKYLV